MANNVVSFPKTNLSEFKTKENVDDNTNIVLTYHIEETLQATLPKFFTDLGIMGFNSQSEKDNKLCALIVESTRAFLCNNYDIHHPLQDIAEAAFESSGDDEYIMVENIIVNKKDGDA